MKTLIGNKNNCVCVCVWTCLTAVWIDSCVIVCFGGVTLALVCHLVPSIFCLPWHSTVCIPVVGDDHQPDSWFGTKKLQTPALLLQFFGPFPKV